MFQNNNSDEIFKSEVHKKIPGRLSLRIDNSNIHFSDEGKLVVEYSVEKHRR